MMLSRCRWYQAWEHSTSKLVPEDGDHLQCTSSAGALQVNNSSVSLQLLMWLRRFPKHWLIVCKALLTLQTKIKVSFSFLPRDPYNLIVFERSCKHYHLNFFPSMFCLLNSQTHKEVQSNCRDSLVLRKVLKGCFYRHMWGNVTDS